METVSKGCGKGWESVGIAGIVIAAAACASEPALETRAAAIDEGCKEWGCNENSPVMGPWHFHELNIHGVPNDKGIVLLDFQKDGVSYHPQIINGSQLIATRSVQGAPGETSTGETTLSETLAGPDLVGGYFQVQTPVGDHPGAVYQIKIVHATPLTMSNVRFWQGQDDQIETYELAYSRPDIAEETPLCNSPPDSVPEQERIEAILYTGDRYDSENKLVTASSYADSAGWFNIACGGSALAKLHLNRRTTAGSAPGYITTWKERQALLKMYVSDLCGTGHAWTRKGTPLHWIDSLQRGDLDGTEYAHESLWNEKGALCLDVHRLGALYDNDDDGFRHECQLDPCGALPATAPAPDAYLLSAVPDNPFITK